MDPSLEEAARMSGARPWRVFRDVSFPLLWPPLVNGMCLSFLYTLSSFGVPAMLGMPVRQFVLTTLIYSQFRLGGMAGIASGLRLSLILLVMAMLVLALSNRLVGLQRRRGGAIMGSRVTRRAWCAWAGGVFRFPRRPGRSSPPPSCCRGARSPFSALAPVAGNYSRPNGPSGTSITSWPFRNSGKRS